VGVFNPHVVYEIVERIYAWPYLLGDLRDDGLDWFRTIFHTEACLQRAAHHGAHHYKFELGLVIPQYDWQAGMFAREFIRGTETVATAIEAFRPDRQHLLDVAFGDN
jgi:hypothetical protein